MSSREKIMQAIQSAAELRELEGQRSVVQAEFERVLHIMLLWPEVTTYGMIRAGWRPTKESHEMRFKSIRPSERNKYMRYHVTAGNGEERSFSFDEVSTFLQGGKQI